MLSPIIMQALTINFLFSLFLCQRAQTIFTLDKNYIKIETHSVDIGFPSLLKQSRPGKHLDPAHFKSYQNDQKICPVNLLKTYIDSTENIRNNESKLLLSFAKPHKAVTTKTISRWIKSALKDAGIDTNIFQGHSTRTTDASTMNRLGADINTILRAGGWSSEKNFAKFYNKPLQNETFNEVMFRKEAI